MFNVNLTHKKIHLVIFICWSTVAVEHFCRHSSAWLMYNPQKVTVLNASVHTEAPSALQVGHGESATLEIIIETDPAISISSYIYP